MSETKSLDAKTVRELLQATPQDLASRQYIALRDCAADRLRHIADLIEMGRREQVEAMLFESPSGDGNGLDNMCIDFTDIMGGNKDEWGGECDINDVLNRLTELAEIAEKGGK